MLLNRENWKLHRFWFMLFVIGIVISILALFVNRNSGFISFPGGSSTTGYLLGLIAGAIIVFEILLWPRKKLFRHWRIGRARTWMAAHIWLGLLTIPLAIVHAGIPWGGSLASMTIILLFLVVASGVFGLVVQNILPKRMKELVCGETVYSQINAVTQQIIAESDALVSAATGTIVGNTDWSELYPADKGGNDNVNVFVGASRSIANIYGRAVISEIPEKPIPKSEIVASAYESEIRNYLEFGNKGTSKLRDSTKQHSFFDDLGGKVVPEAKFLVNNLRSFCDERRDLDRQVKMHHWLHLWLAVHLPLSIALLVLLIWHAIVATKYSGIFSFF